MRQALVVIVVVLAACRAHAPAASAPASAAALASEQRDQPVTVADLQILERADALLATTALWNRHDTRDCLATEVTWSLFCALHAASLEVLGTYDHRRVALQEVRFAVEEATRGQALHHRLMDYNNLATTRFEDIKQVLAVARARVRARLAQR